MGRIEHSIALAKESWRVLRDDKKLTLLPLLSLVATLVVGATFVVPMFLVAGSGTGGYSAAKPLVWILGFVGYVVLAFVVIFFNAALVFAADRRLNGRDVTIGEALGEARSRMHVLLPWAVVSATVSIVLRAVENRGGLFGRIVGSLAGVAWSVVTFLVLPVLVFEGVGPIEAVKRSGALFKRTWGENLVANAGIGIVAMLAILAGAIPLGLVASLGGPATVVGIAGLVAWVLTVSLVATTLTGILQTALYRYATEGKAVGFDDGELRAAFRTRRNGGGWLN